MKIEAHIREFHLTSDRAGVCGESQLVGQNSSDVSATGKDIGIITFSCECKQTLIIRPAPNVYILNVDRALLSKH